MRRSRSEQNRPFYAAVGARIAKARTGKMTQEELARKTGLTRTSVINIEKGRQQILLHTLMDMARALQAPLEQLVPSGDDIETALRDQPQKGLEWIQRATATTKKAKVAGGANGR